MLFLLKVFLDAPLYPYDASEEDEGHWRQDYETVVHITCRVERLRNHSESQERATSEKLTEECHDYENHTISGTVCQTVEE